MQKQHGLKGKPSNRTLPPDQGKRSNLNTRCKAKDLANWKKCAESKGITLSEFVAQTLNKELILSKWS